MKHRKRPHPALSTSLSEWERFILAGSQEIYKENEKLWRVMHLLYDMLGWNGLRKDATVWDAVDILTDSKKLFAFIKHAPLDSQFYRNLTASDNLREGLDYYLALNLINYTTRLSSVVHTFGNRLKDNLLLTPHWHPHT